MYIGHQKPSADHTTSSYFNSIINYLHSEMKTSKL
jgi:hypothetical protein